MKKSFKKFSAMLLSCILAFSCVAPASAASVNANLSNILIDAVVEHIVENYKYEATAEELYSVALKTLILDNPELLDAALKAMYGSLDQYSQYFTTDEFNRFIDSMKGEFCGIGVTIMEFEDGLLITEVHKQSPAEAVGFSKGDVIVSADGTDIRGMAIEEARSYIVGAEGTPVKIGIIRNGQPMEFDVIRGNVVTEAGFYQILEGNIGYIQFSAFDQTSDDFMKSALEALKDTKSIILDLRYNPGGTLEDLQSIAGMTLPKGPVMHLSYKDNQLLTIENDKNGFSKKLVVLVNGATASAAEAFSAAVQDYNVGVVVGERTVGKGTMQVVNSLLFGGGYKLTVAEYLSPEKRTINKIGVIPDYGVEPKTVKYSDDYFEKVTYDRVLRLGDTGADVLAMEQRLNIMGYGVGVPDKVFDEDTFYAVKKYQEVSGLYPYGVLDITTQLSIHSFLQTKDIVLDSALEKAIEIAGGDIDAYIKEAAAERTVSQNNN